MSIELRYYHLGLLFSVDYSLLSTDVNRFCLVFQSTIDAAIVFQTVTIRHGFIFLYSIIQLNAISRFLALWVNYRDE
jgi:hypothetical protein